MPATAPNKTCTRCHVPKTLDSFGLRSRSKDGRRPDCKECRSKEFKAYYAILDSEVKRARSEATAERKQELQEEVIAHLLKTGCTDCPEGDPVVLEFDHVRGEKVADISRLITAQNREALWEEIKKCEVVCANCHRRRTAQRGGWFKDASNGAEYGA